MELVHRLLDVDTYTELGIWNIYRNMRVAKGNKDKLMFVWQAGQYAPLTMDFYCCVVGEVQSFGFGMGQYFVQENQFFENKSLYISQMTSFRSFELFWKIFRHIL